jgi:hypothetical protein
LQAHIERESFEAGVRFSSREAMVRGRNKIEVQSFLSVNQLSSSLYLAAFSFAARFSKRNLCCCIQSKSRSLDAFVDADL